MDSVIGLNRFVSMSSSVTVIVYLLLAHCGLILANERILVDEHSLANGNLRGNHHSLANGSFLGNQHSLDNGSLLEDVHALANGSLLEDVHALANGSLLEDVHALANGSFLGNQHSSANESGLSDTITCENFARPKVPRRDINCPTPEDIPGCVCRQGFGRRGELSNSSSRVPTSLKVSCTKYVEIQRAFGSLRTRRIRNMVLRNCHTRLPAGLFKGLEVYELHLSKACTLRLMSSGHDVLPFLGLENSLQQLKFDGFLSDSGCSKRKLTSVRLSNLNRLRWLIISGFHIPIIGQDFFAGGAPRCLQNFYVLYSDLQRVENKSLAGLHNLKALHLSDNKLHIYSRAWLPSPLLKLKVFVLSNNNLYELPENAFSGMPSLKRINLYGNYITTLPETTWSAIWEQLSDLSLTRNPLACDTKMEWIKRMRSPWMITGLCGFKIKTFLKNKNN